MGSAKTSLILRLGLGLALVLAGAVADAAVAVTTGRLNFRAGPNTSSRIFQTLKSGQTIQVVSRGSRWTKVMVGRRVGYVSNSYIRVATRNEARFARNSQTEGTYCHDCEVAARGDQQSDFSKLADMLNGSKTNSKGNNCLTQKMIAAAKSVHRNNFGGRARGGGKCALAVRMALNKAGIWQGGGIGHARDMVPGLKRMGFKNIITKGMTPKSAPAGTILVYGRALKGAKGCTGLGTTYGHVEIKESNSSYIYDANPSRHIQQLYKPACRPLIGVMQATDDCPTCKKSVKSSCGV